MSTSDVISTVRSRWGCFNATRRTTLVCLKLFGILMAADDHARRPILCGVGET